MVESIEKVAALESDVRTLTGAVRELTLAMQKNNERLERLAILEVSHNNSDKAIGRAFEALKAHEEAADSHREENNKEHKVYDRAIWTSAGFSAAVMVFWTIFGLGMKATIDDVVKSVAEMRAHVVMDKVMTESDLYKFHKLPPQP